jgi:hypothetical protein
MSTKFNQYILLLLIGPWLSSVALAANPGYQTSQTGKTTAVIELYTSEGCINCPPAERFLKQLLEQQMSDREVIALAFHVDYWNDEGWEDPFSHAQYGDRQRTIAIRNQLNSLYTPQFVLYGKDFPAYENIPQAVDIINKSKPQATLQTITDLNKQALQVDVKITAETERAQTLAQTYLLITENNLVSDIKDGDNQGKTLHHYHVVRTMIGPFSQGGHKQLSLTKTLQLDPKWKRHDLHLVIYTQDSADGTTLQAMQLPLINSGIASRQ